MFGVVPCRVCDCSLTSFLCLSQAYYRQGVALQCMGRHGEALAAFSQGLAQDPKSMQLLSGLVEAAMKSPLRGGSLVVKAAGTAVSYGGRMVDVSQACL